MLVHVSGSMNDKPTAEIAGVLSRLSNITLTPDPVKAEVILLARGDAKSIKRSPAYMQFPEKCITMSDSDVLDYYIPALYASNHIGLLSKGRALTCSPYSSLFIEQGNRNAWIDRRGDQPLQKTLLYSFMGGSTCMLRKRMFQHYEGFDRPDVRVLPTDHYRHWASEPEGKITKSDQQRLYIETMRSSKFALCPRGASPSSIRLFEAMEMGIAPVVLADTWIPVEGIDWSFCLFVKETQLGDLDAIVRSHESEWQQRGAAAQRTFEAHFSPASLGITLERQFRQLVEQRSHHREQIVRAIYPLRQAYGHVKAVARSQLRSLVLAGFRLAGRKFPYELNR